MEQLHCPLRSPYGHRRYIAGLFGVTLVSDVGEKLCDMGIRPWLGRKRQAALDCVRDAGVLFIHVPKNAGMSISNALYGRQIKHRSMRYYGRVAPDIARELPSFAILRDPVDRFLSAYAYARAGGSLHNSIAVPFHKRYRAFGCVDDALDHVEAARSVYDVDHVFRPQSWYVTGRRGAVAVKQLFLMDQMHGISDVAPGLGATSLPRLNRAEGNKPAPTAGQIDRINRLYRHDVRLIEQIRTVSPTVSICKERPSD